MNDEDVDALLDKVRDSIRAITTKRTGYVILLVPDGGKLGFVSNLQNESVCQVLAQALEHERGN
jgi:hypothetical protein